MILTVIGLTYLGAACCYVASPATPTDAGTGAPLPLRIGGGLLLGLGLGVAVWERPVGDGLLVWLSAAMAACSMLVIAGPLLDRFVTVSGLLAFGLTVLGVVL